MSVKVEMKPVIDIWSLTEALEAQYHWGLDAHTICQMMFRDEYYNNSFKSYWFAGDELFRGYSWQNETKITQENLIRSFLRDLLPNHERVLIDVSW